MLHHSLRHLGLPDRIRACLFDLDGVLTDTASVHTRAWKAMFDEYLGAHGQPPFDPAADYQKYVDGRRRDDGVRCFLTSRGITLSDGNPDDPPDRDTVNGLANRKNEVFQTVLHRDGITVFDGSRRYLQAVADARVPAAVVSSSANTAQVLELTGLDRYLPVRVDGVTMREQRIPGKPAPDSFLRAAQLLGVPPEQAAVFEDALSGCGPAGAAGLGAWWGWIGWARPRRCGARTPTWWSKTWPTCWRTGDQR